jgi:hypothetical protein
MGQISWITGRDQSSTQCQSGLTISFICLPLLCSVILPVYLPSNYASSTYLCLSNAPLCQSQSEDFCLTTEASVSSDCQKLFPLLLVIAFHFHIRSLHSRSRLPDDKAEIFYKARDWQDVCKLLSLSLWLYAAILLAQKKPYHHPVFHEPKSALYHKK